MNKPITRRQHILTDYMYGPLIAAAPEICGFSKDAKVATLLCRLIGGGTLAATALTRAEDTLLPVVPFKLHLAGDAANGLFALGAPWLFGFADVPKARNTFLVIGAVSLMAAALTQPEEMP